MRALSVTLALSLVLAVAATALAAPTGKIVIAQGVDPTTLDPQWHEETPAYNVLLNIYDTLLFRDKELKIAARRSLDVAAQREIGGQEDDGIELVERLLVEP